MEKEKLKLMWFGLGILGALAALIAVYFILSGNSVNINIDSNEQGAQVSGGVRNCIKSVLGNPPSCSDNDGKLKRTTLNGKFIGECRGLDSNNQCIK